MSCEQGRYALATESQWLCDFIRTFVAARTQKPPRGRHRSRRGLEMRCDGSDHCIDGEVDDLNAVEFMDVR